MNDTAPPDGHQHRWAEEHPPIRRLGERLMAAGIAALAFVIFLDILYAAWLLGASL